MHQRHNQIHNIVSPNLLCIETENGGSNNPINKMAGLAIIVGAIFF